MNMKKDTYNKPPASPPGLFEQDSNLRDIQCSYRKGISEHPGRIHRVSTIILETSWGCAVPSSSKLKASYPQCMILAQLNFHGNINMNMNMMKRDTYNKPYGLFELDADRRQGSLT